jgi:hypothetical protein
MPPPSYPRQNFSSDRLGQSVVTRAFGPFAQCPFEVAGSTDRGKLIFVKVSSLDLAVEDAATSTMDATSRNTVSSLQFQIEMLSRITRALSFSPSIMESSEPGDGSPVANLSKGNLVQWPALESIYVATTMATGCRWSGWTGF